MLKVVNEDGVHPYCPICHGGEYMLNEDGNRNTYCGSCGCHLDWSDVDDEVRNNE